MESVRRRVALKLAGPRALAVIGSRVFVAGYFSDSLDVVDLARPDAAVVSINLSRENALPLTRLGEAVFNDATICHQGWLSCATCHGDDARTDGLDWDLPNDGIGNPKKARSLLFSQVTPPVMSLGIRANAAVAVRAGFRNSLFSLQPEEMPAAIDAWIAALKPVPSPHLVGGSLSPAAQRGEQLFHSRKVGCADCHAGDLFTDLGSYDVGTRGTFDRPGDVFDTPTLREVWRTAPYLHDGSAATLREVITTRNRTDQHGSTSQLAPWEIEDLLAYVLSL
jgi:cytochrome c peroxidase